MYEMPDDPDNIDMSRIRTFYTPRYYTSMTSLDDDGITEFVGLARAAHVDEVLWMLRTEEWRCRKTGAWFALIRDEPEVQRALDESLLTSRGSLTAPELGAVLAQRRGPACLPLLLAYQERGIRDQYHGPQGEITALIRDLGGTPLLDDASSGASARMNSLRTTAARITAAAG